MEVFTTRFYNGDVDLNLDPTVAIVCFVNIPIRVVMPKSSTVLLLPTRECLPESATRPSSALSLAFITTVF